MTVEPETGIELREYTDAELEARVLALVLTMAELEVVAKLEMVTELGVVTELEAVTELEVVTESKLLVEARLISLLKLVAKLVVGVELEPTDMETLEIELPMLVEPNVIT